MRTQYVIFKLNNAEYGIDISSVNEIAPYEVAKRIPNTPKYIEGMINLRSVVTPLINLREKFHISQETDMEHTRILISTINGQQIGFIVDDSSQVIEIDSENIDTPPDIIRNNGTQYIEGIGRVDGRLIVLINLEKILTKEEKQQVEKIS